MRPRLSHFFPFDNADRELTATSPNSPIPACSAPTHHHATVSSTPPPTPIFTKALAAFLQKRRSNSSTPSTQTLPTVPSSPIPPFAPLFATSQAGSKKSSSTAPCSATIAPGAKAPASTMTNTSSVMAMTSSLLCGYPLETVRPPAED